MQSAFLTYPYPSHRTMVIASNGMVATSHPLASQAGLSILQAGGSAVDAAIATAVALTVLEPTSNGIGGDAFAMVWDGERLHGLNGSGRAPGALSVEAVHRAGYDRMPRTGWLTVTVPGAPAAWQDLHARFGKLPFEQLFAPAITYAEQGHPLAPTVARQWSVSLDEAQQRTEAMFEGFHSTFAPNGFVPTPGAWFVSPGHARALRRIATCGAHDFYHGELAHALVSFAQQTGGLISYEDLAAHTSTWVDPICVTYRGHEIWELPPNGQGLAALLALGILEGLAVARYPRDSGDAYHLQIEAMKLAFADTYRYVADSSYVSVPIQGLLDPGYIATRRALIGSTARAYEAGQPAHGGTVYLCTADRDGQMVSMIQSNFWGFGSGIVVPEWGISLHSRGYGFTLEPGHPNVLESGKRPFHTIIPAFLTQNGQPVGPFGLMGGSMQPQGHTQLMVNTLDYGMNPQSAIDAPRWRVEGNTVFLEMETPRHITMNLMAHGHDVQADPDPAHFGRGQIIWRLSEGVYISGSEPRCDGCAAGW